ncbi:uncharacterized protein RHOBADRAFT_56533 [Rhodotorula graminis WP1]|uniref:SPIN90/Ldb17 leucine-rich domain-containing protein n=1 Tax=Rhodotorula graminis (strain WP1) TaxID=578459 RepID=A0A0P9F7P9_RHOGW|nr:uncharacterized protein RHOBADRAFT_56533 [Rhodotorula graminis WP1]KPV71710.1 hypothetical protein RHOBADRAFT_56533 [Rhodotorula graminis WP1]
MEAQQEWHFSSPDQFWDHFLAAPGALDHALLALLSSPLFTSHVDRMTDNIITSISHPEASSSTLFISLMLVLHLGEGANPLTTAGVWADARKPGAGVTVGSSKVYRFMRRRWREVVPVLMNRVWHAGVVHEVLEEGVAPDAAAKGEALVAMPADGWEERVGTAATAVLYELCRVQKLGPEELADFSFDFVSRLFSLVERTRDVEDETFNYSLIKLLIALNEQFMISTVPAERDNGAGKLPPPILPTVVSSGGKKRERGPNMVLEVLKEKEHESKTFGENIIFILNRADGTPDSLCVSLLILKILYLLFTTSGTQEYFYTNDLCVLVDVFIRELYNLDEESEGLKHTYLRVLHPLLTNTQLRHHPYKRPELRRCLESLVAQTYYRACDPTTRRLVERNLRASWCQTLRSADAALSGLIGGSKSATGSTLSVDAVATTCDDEGAVDRPRRRKSKGSRRHASVDDSAVSYGVSPPSVVAHGHDLLGPVAERSATGGVPDVVRQSSATAEWTAVEEDRQRSWTRSPEDEHPPSELPLPDKDVPASSTVISAGHDLLHPIAVRHHGSSSPTHPLPATTAPTLVTPRPRSQSLHALHVLHEPVASHGHFRPAPPPPSDSPDPHRRREGSFSSHSSRSSLHSSHPSHHSHEHHAHLPSYHPAHHHSHAPAGSSPMSSSATAAARRRRPPPPPSHHAHQLDGDGPGSAQTSRPQTPHDAPPSPVSGPAHLGASTGTRRRAPPPPGAGGRGSPRAGGPGDREEDVRRGVEALAVS